MTPRSWENWAARAESRGYKTLAPSWPGLEGEVEALNEDSTPLTKLDVLKIVDHYEQIIRGLDSQADHRRPLARRHDHAAAHRP